MRYLITVIDESKILEGPTFSTQKKPKKLINMLHGYGDNAENFINLDILVSLWF